MSNVNVIEVTDLKKEYQLPRREAKNNSRSFEAVKGISFQVARGEIFGILGPNGAGKTTTLEIIEGLKTQTGGTIKVLGLDNILDRQAVQKKIGVQLQSSEYMQHMSLGELLELFASLYGKTVNIENLLSLVNLVDKQHSQVKELSGGQKQRFTLASSLVNEPEIIFLDEPTTGLDPRARRDVWELIKDFNKKGITIVMTTHYMEEAEFLCDRVAVMDSGQILAINNPKTLIEDLSHTTQVSFLTDEAIDPQIWDSISQIEKVYNDHPKVVLEITSLDILGEIVEKLKHNNVSFSSFTVRTASLEDVYLDLTGKVYQE
ncbi:MAG: ABC transporter ATP-binding protein [Candidatus Doudnabacteria bacterium]